MAPSFRWSMCLVALLGVSLRTAEAGTIESATVVLHSVNDAINFDFSASADVLHARPLLTGLDLNWTVNPGSNSTHSQVVAGLAIPSFDVGDRINSALDVTLPSKASGPVRTTTSFFNAEGLPIGPSVLDEFARDGNDSIGATLFTSGEGSSDLNDFFAAGGTLEVSLQLTTDSPAPIPSEPSGPSGPSGGSVPEPMSVTVWATAVGGTFIWSRRRKGNRITQTSSDAS